MVLSITLIVALGGFLHTRPPRPLNAAAPASEFSAARAASHVRWLASEPHPIGTDAHARVRDRLVAELQQMGLQPEVFDEIGMYTSVVQGASVARVRNVLVRLAGRRPGKALLLSAHYDSVPTGPGAADNSASVAAVLETLRALRTGPPLDNDLWCLFEDGEEPATLGAAAFAADPRRIERLGLVLNFDYRGDSGPVYMFETSRGNGRLIDGMRRAASFPFGTSFAGEVRRLLSNGTDLTPFLRAGVPGLNFAAIESPYVYHAETDTPDRLDLATLQHQGDLMLSLARYFGHLPLADLSGADAIYFDVPGGLIAYTQAWAWPVTAGTIALLAGTLWWTRRHGTIRLAQVLWAVPAFIGASAVVAIAGYAAWFALCRVYPVHAVLICSYNSHWYLLAFVCLAVAGFAWIQARLESRIGADALGLGALLVWGLLLVATTAWLPGASYLFTWPLLPLLLAYVLLGSRMRVASAELRALLAVGGAAIAIYFYAPLVQSLYVSLGPKTIVAPLFALCLLLGAIAPVSRYLIRGRLLPGLPAVAGIGFLVAGSLTSGFDDREPRPSELFYVRDGHSGNAYWLSGDLELDDWTRRFIPDGTARQPAPELFGNSPKLWRRHPATAMPFEPPGIEVFADQSDGSTRSLHLRVQSKRAAPRIRIEVEGAAVLESIVEGRRFPDAPRTHWFIQAYAMPDEALDVELRLQPHQPFRIRATDITYGLAAVGAGSRPAGFMPHPFGSSDTVQVVSSLDVAADPNRNTDRQEGER